MQINKPDQGIMKGIGPLQKEQFVKRKFFPNIRNQHQFQFTHQHRNQYKSTFSAFNQSVNPKDYLYSRVKKNPNQSQIKLGEKIGKIPSSWNQSVFSKHDPTQTSKAFKQKQQGLGINQYQQRTGEKIKYSTTSHDLYSTHKNKHPMAETSYKYSRSDRFNPITGQYQKHTSFGYEDYVPVKQKRYKANNHTLVPFSGEKIDIISGRKLQYG